MRMSIAALFVALGFACATRDPKMIKTQVVTYPDGGLVEFNGQPAGRAPAAIVLPQDAEGRLTGRAVVRALPNTRQENLYAQTRTFEPSHRAERVPNRIMIDMRQRGTNAPSERTTTTTHVEQAAKASLRPNVPYTERSKPTQAVGLDRWNPGHH